MILNETHVKAGELLLEAINGDTLAQNKFSEALLTGFKVKEGVSSSDLPTILSPSLSQIALADYADQAKIWNLFASREVLPDFERSEYFSLTPFGDEDVEPATAGDTFYTGGLPTVPEYGEYSRLRFDAAGKGLRLKKGGVAIQFSWESLLNPRNIARIPRVFAEFGRRAAVKEDQEATRPLLNFTENFTAGNGNVLTGAAQSLSLDSIEAAFEQIATQQYNGRQVTPASSYVLLVPPTLEMRARHLMSIDSVETVEGAGTATEVRIRSGNPIAGKFSLVVNPYLTQMGGSATGWYLLPKPGTTPNPSVVNLFLQGHERPEIFVKRTTASAPEAGSFENDDYETKVRHVVTGEFIEPAATMYSDGTD